MQGVYRRRRSWCIDTKSGGRRIRRGGFPSRAAAEEWLWAQQQVMAPSVARALEEYQAGRGGRCRSADRHRQMAAHLVRHLGETPSGMVRQRDVDRYVQLRADEGAADKTAYNELALLRTALRYGWRNDRCPDPPRFTLSRPHCERERVASAEEVRCLLGVAGPDLQRVVLAAWCCGLRRGEMMAAKWSQVNPIASELVLEREQTKGGRARRVALPPDLLGLLRSEPRHPEHVWCRVRRGPNGRGRLECVAWTKTTLRRAWEEACARAGLPDLHLHDLRRSMASTAQARGHGLAAVREQGGWEDPGALERHYLRAGDAQVAAVGADLLGMLGPLPAPGPRLRVLAGGRGGPVGHGGPPGE